MTDTNDEAIHLHFDRILRLAAMLVRGADDYDEASALRQTLTTLHEERTTLLDLANHIMISEIPRPTIRLDRPDESRQLTQREADRDSDYRGQ